jgi:hypothetical protein
MKYAYLVTIAALSFGLVVYGKTAHDLSGTWTIEYHDDNGHEVDYPKLVLHQSGQKLSGTFGNKDWPVTGEVKADHMEFSYMGYASDGSSGTVAAQAFIKSDNKLSGRMMSPVNGGEFTATKQ